MPALRLPARRSARLRALTNSPALTNFPKEMAGSRNIELGVDGQVVPATSRVSSAKQRGRTQTKRRGRGSKVAATSQTHTGTSSQATTGAAQPLKPRTLPPVGWEGRRTDLLVEWIVTHAADRHILFHDRGSTISTDPPPAPDDRPSGKNKKEVGCAIARHIFDNDPDYPDLVASEIGKLGTSVTNHLQTLKTKYRKFRSELKGTGGGVIPDGVNPPAANLLESVLARFPYYSDLDPFWKGIPSFDSEIISSHPNVDHAQSFLDAIPGNAPASASKTAGGSAEEALDAQEDMIDEDVDRRDGSEDIDRDGMDHRYGVQDQFTVRLDEPDDGAAFNDDSDNDHDHFNMDIDLPLSAGPSNRWAPGAGGPVRSTTSNSKGKAPVREGRSAFARHTPYTTRSPTASSAGSVISKRSLSGSAVSSTRMTSASGSMAAKLEELSRASDLLQARSSSSSSSRHALQMEYAIRKKELEMKEKELQAQRELTAAELQKEETLKRLDLQILERKVQLAEKQIEYVRTMKMLGIPTGADSPSTQANFTHEDFSDVQFMGSTGGHHHFDGAAAGPSATQAAPGPLHQQITLCYGALSSSVNQP